MLAGVSLPVHAACPLGFKELYDARGNPICLSEGAYRSRQIELDRLNRQRSLHLRQGVTDAQRAQPETEETIRQRERRDNLRREQRQRLAPKP